MGLKYIQYWGFPYLRFVISRMMNPPISGLPVHIMFCFVDHFEPGHGKVDEQKKFDRVKRWVEDYPKLADHHKDSDGYPPRHTWFYPPHYYEPQILDDLMGICKKGFGEIEFHLHHQDDTSESLRKKILDSLDLYRRHGIFQTGTHMDKPAYGFIHGDWALDNSRCGKYCGVNDELMILKETGCYADFTMPSVNESQSRKINSIYYAKDDPNKSKSYDSGFDVEVGKQSPGDLMMIQGPLLINWKDWKHKFYPSLDSGDITGDDPPTQKRIDGWIKCHIHVKGKEDWIFIKVHTHGALEKHFDVLLGNQAHQMYSYLESRYNDENHYQLHYVSSREMYNIIKAAENGLTGSPNLYRDYIIKKYAYLH